MVHRGRMPQERASSGWLPVCNTATLLITVGLCLLGLATAQPTPYLRMYSLSSYSGSTEGGLELTIQGTGFSSDQYNGYNKVFIGDRECRVIQYKTTTNQVVCETPAAPGQYTPAEPITVVSADFPGQELRSDTQFSFTFGWWTMVRVMRVSPAAAMPGDTVALRGLSGGARGQFSYSNIDRVVVGNELCRLLPEDQQFPNLYDPAYSWLDTVLCTLLPSPIPSQQGPRSVQAMIHMDNAGNSSMEDVNKFLSARGDVFNLQLIPMVTGVSPSMGSLGGGTRLVLSGGNFGMDLMGINVTVNSNPCTAISVSPTEVVCETSPKSAADPGDNILFPGARGARLDLFTSRPPGVSQPLTNKDVYSQYTPSSTKVVVDLLELPQGASNLTGASLSTFFIPPLSGGYKFYLTTYDYGELYISRTPGTDSSLEMIAKCAGGAQTRSWPPSSWPPPWRVSAPIELMAGEPYFLRAVTDRPRRAEPMSVGVWVPSPVQTPLSVKETQQLDIRVDYHGEQQNIMVKSKPPHAAIQRLLLKNVTTDLTKYEYIMVMYDYDASARIDVADLECDSVNAALHLALVENAGAIVSVSAECSYDAASDTTTFQITYWPPDTIQDESAVLEVELYDSSNTPATEDDYSELIETSVVQEYFGPLRGSITVSLPESMGKGIKVDLQRASPGSYLQQFSQDMGQLVGEGALVTFLAPPPEQEQPDKTWWGATVTFNWQEAPRPLLEVALERAQGLNMTAEVEVKAVSTELLGGTFDLSFMGSPPVTLPASTGSALAIERSLETLTTLNAESVTVQTQWFSETQGATFRILFNEIVEMEDFPMIMVDYTNLRGTNAWVTVTEVQKGSLGYNLRPIPADYLRTPERTPDTVLLSVNDMPAACQQPDECKFTYDAAATPVITSIAYPGAAAASVPAPVTLTGGALLTITGMGFNPDVAGNTLRICGREVAPTTASSTLLTFTVPATCLPGPTQMQLVVDGKGFATYNTSSPTEFLLDTLNITGTFPGMISVGAIVDIVGMGLMTEVPSETKVFIGDLPCEILEAYSSPTRLRCISRSGGANTASTLRVTVASSRGSQAFSVFKEVATRLSQSFPLLTDLSPPWIGPAPGALVTLGGQNFPASYVDSTSGSVWLVDTTMPGAPEFKCSVVTMAVTSVSCMTATRVPLGTYSLQYRRPLTDGCNDGMPCDWSLTSTVLQIVVEFSVDMVSPHDISIGGGSSLTLSGAGFASYDPTSPTIPQWSNIVMLRVPVSTTFPNGVVPCDVRSATPTEIVCQSRPYCSADATAEDPNGVLCEFKETVRRPLYVVQCRTATVAGDDWAATRCWADSSNPRAFCAGNEECGVSYEWAATPLVTEVIPDTGVPGQDVVVMGVMGLDKEPLPMDSIVMIGGVVCPPSLTLASSDGSLACTVPDLGAGSYQVSVITANDAGNSTSLVQFTIQPVFNQMSSNTSSILGGLELTLKGSLFNVAVLENNVVMVGSLDCPVVNASSDTLVCVVPAPSGLVAEYYSQLYLQQLPSFDDKRPQLMRFEKQLNFLGGYSAFPGMDVGQFSQGWAARYTGYLYAEEEGEYQFFLTSDDGSRLWVNNQLVVDNDGMHAQQERHGTIFLNGRSFNKIRITYFNYYGYAVLTFSWILPDSSTKAVVPATSLFTMPPEAPLPVSLEVNGVPATGNCTVCQPGLGMRGGGMPEGGNVDCMDSCELAYSLEATPFVSGQETVPRPGVALGAPTLVFTGMGLLGPGPMPGWTWDALDPPKVKVFVGSPMPGEDGANCTDLEASDMQVSCTAPPLPAGIYPITVNVPYVGLANNVAQVQYALDVLSVTPRLGSVNGGTQLLISGAGFSTTPERMGVRLVHPNGYTVACNISAVEVGPDTQNITCVTGNFAGLMNSQTSVAVSMVISLYNAPEPTREPLRKVLSAGTFTFSTLNSPRVTGVDYTPVPNALFLVTITGTGFLPAGNTADNVTVRLGEEPCDVNVDEVTATRVTCWADGLHAGSYEVTVNVAGAYGDSQRRVFVDVPLTLTSVTPRNSSLAGGRELQLSGAGFSPRAEENRITINDVPCAILSGTGARAVRCRIGSVWTGNLTDFSYDIAIEIGKYYSNATIAGQVTFNAGLTPLVASLSPTRGSTQGGTVVTFTGSNLLGVNPATAPSVLISNRVCTVSSFNNTQVVCTTGSLGFTNDTAEVLLLVDGMGAAANNQSADPITYGYVDLWSRASSWGNGPLPEEGDSVWIPQGQYIVLDTSPPQLELLVVEGTLLFDDGGDRALDMSYCVIINGGTIRAGRPNKPFKNKASITLHGDPSMLELPVYGAKMLAVRYGTLDLHGLPKLPPWTRLNATAMPGNKSIALAQPVNWAVGDLIVIVPSGIDFTENDEAVITSVSADGLVLSLDRALQFRHVGSVSTFGGVDVDMRAEVACLTRNVVVQGDDSTEQTHYGAHIMAHSPAPDSSIVRISNVEVRRAGQAFRLGRYPIHLHMIGDVPSSFVANNSVHHTFNRGIAIHGVHKLKVTNNVAYDTMGHTFFIEDGIEQQNMITGNLGIFTKVSPSLLMTDTTPTTFWITNPNNVIEDNVAAGNEAWGFWFQLDPNPGGPSFTQSVCPRFTPLLSFARNKAHSSKFYGLRVFPEYFPRSHGACWGGDPVPAVFSNFTAYANGMKGAIATMVSTITFDGFKVVDNGGGMETSGAVGKEHGGGIEITWVEPEAQVWHSRITNSLVVGKSYNGLTNFVSPRGIRGVLTQSHTSYLDVVNVTFVNFDQGDLYAIEPCAKCKCIQGGFTTTVSALRFSNAPQVIKWPYPHAGVYADTDGSLTGTAGSSAVMGTGLLSATDCRAMPGTVGGVACAPGLTFRRLGLNNHYPGDIHFRPVTFFVAGERTRNVSMNHCHYVDDGYQLDLIAGRRYEFAWVADQRTDPNMFTLTPEPKTRRDWLLLQSYQEQSYDHWHLWGLPSDSPSLGHVPVPLVDPPNTFFYNGTVRDSKYNDTILTIYVGGDSGTALQAKGHMCPDQGCGVPPGIDGGGNKTVKMWSDNATWADFNGTGGVPPKAGQDLIIPPDWMLVLDISPPPLGRLTIQGALVFQDLTAPGASKPQGRLAVADDTSLELQADSILVTAYGLLQVGSPVTPYQGRATITLRGSRRSTQLALSNDLNLGAKSLSVLGKLRLQGMPCNRTWTTLDADVQPGTRTLLLADPVTWMVGASVVVAPSRWDPTEAEVGVIQSISDDGMTVVLTSQLTFFHKGTRTPFRDGFSADMRAEVGLLTSNLVVRGDMTGAASSVERTRFGARISVVGFMNQTGQIQVDSVEFVNCGQSGIGSPVLAFLGVKGLGANSSVTNNLFHDNYYTVVHIEDTNGLLVQNNVMYYNWDSSTLRLESGVGNSILGNLGLGTHALTVGKNVMQSTEFSTTFWIRAWGNHVRDNAAAGSWRFGFRGLTDVCSLSSNSSSRNASQPFFTGNRAHTNLIGLMVAFLDDGSGSSLPRPCQEVNSFLAYRNWDYGILGDNIGTDFVLRGSVLAENKRGITIGKANGMLAEAYINITDSAIVGSASACADRPHPFTYDGVSNEVASPTVGILSPGFSLGWMMGPPHPWDEPASYPTLRGLVDVSRVRFYGFSKPMDNCNNVFTAWMNNPRMRDNVPFTRFSNISFFGVDPAAKVKMNPPNPGWKVPDKCGNMDCDGPLHALLQDVDGSFLGGSAGAALVGFNGAERKVVQQGIAVNPKLCALVTAYGAYVCPGALKYRPFVIESRDADSEKRRVAPVYLSVNSAFTDVLNGPSDHGWCSQYTCQKRLSTFWSSVPSASRLFINFTGTPPKVTRLHFPYTDPTDEILVGIQYQDTSRRFVWIETAGRLDAEDTLPQLGMGSRASHGQFWWDQDRQQLWVLLRGASVGVECRTEPVIKLGTSLAMNFRDFYAKDFIKNVAIVLGISASRMKVASAVPGSVVVAYSISPTLTELNRTLPETSFAPPAPPGSNFPPPPPDDSADAPGGSSEKGLDALISVITNAIASGALAKKLGVKILSASMTYVSDTAATAPPVSLNVAAPPPPLTGCASCAAGLVHLPGACGCTAAMEVTLRFNMDFATWTDSLAATLNLQLASQFGLDTTQVVLASVVQGSVIVQLNLIPLHGASLALGVIQAITVKLAYGLVTFSRDFGPYSVTSIKPPQGMTGGITWAAPTTHWPLVASDALGRVVSYTRPYSGITLAWAHPSAAYVCRHRVRGSGFPDDTVMHLTQAEKEADKALREEIGFKWKPCPGSTAGEYTFPDDALVDGYHQFSVSDNVNQPDTGAMHFYMKVDSVAPTSRISTSVADLVFLDEVLSLAPFFLSATDAHGDTYPAGEVAVRAPESGLLSFLCSWDNDRWDMCTSPTTAPGLLDPGSHTLQVRALDAAGNIEVHATLYSFTVTPFIATRGCTYTVRMDDATPAALGLQPNMAPRTSFAFAGAKDKGPAPHTLEVVASDYYGNNGPSTSFSWFIDTRAPGTHLLNFSMFSQAASVALVTIESVDPAAGFLVNTPRVPGLHDMPCASAPDGSLRHCNHTFTFSGLTPGSYVFQAAAYDELHNQDPLPVVVAWQVDPIDTAVNGSFGGSSAKFTVDALRDASVPFSYEWKLDSGPWRLCKNPGFNDSFSLRRLPEGRHTVAVRATGLDNGLVDPTPFVADFIVDVTAPTVLILEAPANVTNEVNATLTVEMSEEGHVEWAVDKGPFRAAPGLTFSAGPLREGAHTVHVRGVDVANNTGAAANATFVVDLGPPETLVHQGPVSPFPDGPAEFVFSSDEPEDVTYEYRVNRAKEWLPVSGSSLTLPPMGKEGIYTLEVRATDDAGNVDETPAIYTWTAFSQEAGGLWGQYAHQYGGAWQPLPILGYVPPSAAVPLLQH